MVDTDVKLTVTRRLWTWPMGLTMLRLLLLPVFLYIMLSLDKSDDTDNRRWLAVAVFAVMAITDKLDGYLARRLNQTSRLGAILDPIADKLLIASSVILLSMPRIAPPGYVIPLWVLIAIYAKDVVVAGGVLAILSIVGSITIHARLLGKASTMLQLTMVIATLLAPDLETLGFVNTPGLVRVCWGIVGGLAIVSCVDYVTVGFRTIQNRAHYRPGEESVEAVS